MTVACDPQALQDRLVVPSAALVQAISGLTGDVTVVGAGGKLGPSLCRLAAAALRESGSASRVRAVSRFTDPRVAAGLYEAGVELLRIDVSDDEALAKVPVTENLVYLVGMKFGSVGNEPALWQANTVLPFKVSRHFIGARQTVLSTGTIYPFVPLHGGGATEDTTPEPVGEYAMSCLGRERAVEMVALETGTPVCIVRLNYAVEMSYGVLVDLALSIRDGIPVDRSATAVNVVWQGYVNEVILRSLELASSPATVLNLAGPETVSIETLAHRLSAALGTAPVFEGEPLSSALLSDATLCHRLYGYPEVTLGELIEATAEWIARGGDVQGKPTKFERRDGKF